MPTHYVSDFEEVTGQKPDDATTEVEAKVVTAPAKDEPKKTTAQTKDMKAK
jgi:hypothetical protein